MFWLLVQVRRHGHTHRGLQPAAVPEVSLATRIVSIIRRKSRFRREFAISRRSSAHALLATCTEIQLVTVKPANSPKAVLVARLPKQPGDGLAFITGLHDAGTKRVYLPQLPLPADSALQIRRGGSHEEISVIDQSPLIRICHT